MNQFHISQPVLCTSDNITGGYGDEIKPVRGKTYTIRAIGFSKRFQSRYLLLKEIVNEARDYRMEGITEPGFDLHHFEPVREKGSSIFANLLVPSRERVSS